MTKMSTFLSLTLFAAVLLHASSNNNMMVHARPWDDTSCKTQKHVKFSSVTYADPARALNPQLWADVYGQPFGGAAFVGQMHMSYLVTAAQCCTLCNWSPTCGAFSHTRGTCFLHASVSHREELVNPDTLQTFASIPVWEQQVQREDYESVVGLPSWRSGQCSDASFCSADVSSANPVDGGTCAFRYDSTEPVCTCRAGRCGARCDEVCTVTRTMCPDQPNHCFCARESAGGLDDPYGWCSSTPALCARYSGVHGAKCMVATSTVAHDDTTPTDVIVSSDWKRCEDTAASCLCAVPGQEASPTSWCAASESQCKILSEAGGLYNRRCVQSRSEDTAPVPASGCDDVHADWMKAYTCAQFVSAGHCGETWMDGLCRRSCGVCV